MKSRLYVVVGLIMAALGLACLKLVIEGRPEGLLPALGYCAVGFVALAMSYDGEQAEEVHQG